MTITHCRPSGGAAAGEIVPCGIGLWNTTIAPPSVGPYRGVVVEMGGLVSGYQGDTLATIADITVGGGGRVDATASYTQGNPTIIDPDCEAGDMHSPGPPPFTDLGPKSVSQSIIAPPLNIPVTARMQSVNPGVSFTVQNDATGLPTGNGTGVSIGANGFSIFGGEWPVCSGPVAQQRRVDHRRCSLSRTVRDL